MNQEQLQTILDDHKLWLLDNTKGKKADLTDANLIAANLTSADLTDANLYGANLTGACLAGADLSYTCVFTFTLGAHFGFAHFGEQYKDGSYIKIGCKGHSLEYWLDNYEEIGKVNNYTDKLIKNYGIQLRALQEIQK